MLQTLCHGTENEPTELQNGKLDNWPIGFAGVRGTRPAGCYGRILPVVFRNATTSSARTRAGLVAASKTNSGAKGGS